MKKIKKRSNTSAEVEDPELEDVEETRSFEIEIDEELEEIVFVHHYRRKWGDDFNSDVEHGLNMEEAAEVVGIMIAMMDAIKMKKLVPKSTPDVIEGNPLQGPNNIEGV